jgi:DnaJ-class molecular chaperone
METQGATADRFTSDAAVAARDCPVCGGDGFLIGDDDAEVQCDACDGSGQVQSDDQAA